MKFLTQLPDERTCLKIIGEDGGGGPSPSQLFSSYFPDGVLRNIFADIAEHHAECLGGERVAEVLENYARAEMSVLEGDASRDEALHLLQDLLHVRRKRDAAVAPTSERKIQNRFIEKQVEHLTQHCRP